jgi:hypothetical protein
MVLHRPIETARLTTQLELLPQGVPWNGTPTEAHRMEVDARVLAAFAAGARSHARHFAPTLGVLSHGGWGNGKLGNTGHLVVSGLDNSESATRGFRSWFGNSRRISKEMWRLQATRGDPQFTDLTSAREYSRQMAERGELRCVERCICRAGQDWRGFLRTTEVVQSNVGPDHRHGRLDGGIPRRTSGLFA